MAEFKKDELPGESILTGGVTWKRIDDFEESGVLYWARPYYHTERNWNRHDIEIEGEAEFPAYTIELTDFDGDEWGVKVMVTQGPEGDTPGMGGVLDGVVVTGIKAAAETIQAYMDQYNSTHDRDE
jgi:hypothetical protein